MSNIVNYPKRLWELTTKYEELIPSVRAILDRAFGDDAMECEYLIVNDTDKLSFTVVFKNGLAFTGYAIKHPKNPVNDLELATRIACGRATAVTVAVEMAVR